jgi:hypothetical protein
MIKTLRITTIIVAIAATILLILPAIYGVRKDPKIEEFLKKPGVVEKFTAAGGQNAGKNDSQSPLVQQAARFASIINPPPPPLPKAAPGAPAQGSAAPTPPAPVAVKFEIVATSYSALNPEKSFVLIDEAGKGLHWVKQGSAIGHVTIETIKDGTIVVRDGARTSEMTVKVKETWRSLLKNPPPSTRSSAVSTSPAVIQTAGQGPVNQIQPSPVTTDKQGLPTPARTGSPPISGRRSLRPGAIPPASERITSGAQTAPEVLQPPPAVEAAPPPQETETPAPEESPAIKAKQARIDKLLSETGSGELTKDEEKKLDEVFKEIEELSKMREAENANDVNAKNANR